MNRSNQGSIVLWAETLEKQSGREVCLPQLFYEWDGGEVYTAVPTKSAIGTVKGSLLITGHPGERDVSTFGSPDDRVRVLAGRVEVSKNPSQPDSGIKGPWRVLGYIRLNNRWELSPVQVLPIKEELFSRTRGLFETDLLADACVIIFGQGSVGSIISTEMARMGIMNLTLVDYDRLETTNVFRHRAGLSHVGRYKTRAVRDLIHDINPHANVSTYESKVSCSTQDLVRMLVKTGILVISAIDDQEGNMILNKSCVEEGKPMIMAGAFHRCCGGQTLVVIPHVTPCYQCFLGVVPEKAHDREISSVEQAQRVAYAERPVIPEPGLAADISPLSIMAVTLARTLLLKDKPTALRSLEEDLAAPWYLWINRRERGSDYEKLKPMGFEVNGIKILRWYGVEYPRDPKCPVCGDFIGQMIQKHGLEISETDRKQFEDHE